MRAIHSEATRYKDLVLATHREVCGDVSNTICWDAFSFQGKQYAPHSVIIGETDNRLKKMGFMPMFVYDKQHFRNAMYPISTRPHAHGLSVENMLALPNLLNHPVAILSERVDINRRDSGNNAYDVLSFLCADRSYYEQKYYLIAVQPQDYHDGILKRGYASKVISYYEIDELKFNAMMRSSKNGQRDLLYFNSKAYNSIRSNSKPIEFSNMQSFSQYIAGYYKPRANLRPMAQEFQAAVQCAITNVMNKMIVGKSDREATFPLFARAIKTLSDEKSTLKDILRARTIITNTYSLTNDRVLKLRVTEQTDKMFAEAYARIMTEKQQGIYINDAAKKINAINVNNSDDVEYLHGEVDKFSKANPTLKNLNITFVGSVANIPCVMRAQEISGQLETAMETQLSQITNQKLSVLRERHLHEQLPINWPEQVQDIENQCQCLEMFGDDGGIEMC